MFEPEPEAHRGPAVLLPTTWPFLPFPEVGDVIPPSTGTGLQAGNSRPGTSPPLPPGLVSIQLQGLVNPVQPSWCLSFKVSPLLRGWLFRAREAKPKMFPLVSAWLPEASTQARLDFLRAAGCPRWAPVSHVAFSPAMGSALKDKELLVKPISNTAQPLLFVSPDWRGLGTACGLQELRALSLLGLFLP